MTILYTIESKVTLFIPEKQTMRRNVSLRAIPQGEMIYYAKHIWKRVRRSSDIRKTF